MSMDNNTGVQTKAMAQRVENEAEVEQLQNPPNPDLNPTATQNQGGSHQGIRTEEWHHCPRLVCTRPCQH